MLRELDVLWKYKVRRFRIVYAIERKKRMIRIFAIGHWREVYEEKSWLNNPPFRATAEVEDKVE